VNTSLGEETGGGGRLQASGVQPPAAALAWDRSGRRAPLRCAPRRSPPRRSAPLRAAGKLWYRPPCLLRV